jgi:type II secretory pathway pseudopilin PulG
MRRRAGVALIDVLAALVIIAMAGAAVVTIQVRRRGSVRAANAREMTALVDSARTLARQRRETVRLRVYDDGLWSLETATATDPLAAGTITAPPAPLDLSVDARGGCRASPGWIPREAHRIAFEAGKCRWNAE